MRPSSKTILWWAAVFAVWTALALLEATESALSVRHSAAPVALRALVLDRLADWYSYGVFLPLLALATHRWPLDRRHLATRIIGHLALVLVVVVLRNTIVLPLFGDAGGTVNLPQRVITHAMALAALDGVLHALEYHRRYRERETLALQLRASLSDARLHALRAQLHPHFLFNTLNAATALLYSDPRSADRMLTQLADLLRFTLRSDPTHETPLEEEMAILDRYLAIMRIRFADRVTVACAVDSRVTNALVPSFLLQPIVENAFEHGIAALKQPGHIAIDVRPDGETLLVSVRDNGPGPRQSPSSNDRGIGLANTRRRLAELYGDRGSLSLFPSADGGSTVEVRVPLSIEPATA